MLRERESEFVASPDRGGGSGLRNWDRSRTRDRIPSRPSRSAAGGGGHRARSASKGTENSGWPSEPARGAPRQPPGRPREERPATRQAASAARIRAAGRTPDGANGAASLRSERSPSPGWRIARRRRGGIAAAPVTGSTLPVASERWPPARRRTRGRLAITRPGFAAPARSRTGGGPAGGSGRSGPGRRPPSHPAGR